MLRLGISKNPIGTGGLWTKIAPLGSTENCRINFSFLSSIIFYVFFTPYLWASKGTPSALEKNIIPWQNTHLLGTSPHSEHCLYLSDSCHPLSFALQKCWCYMQTLDSESLSGTQLGACFFFFFLYWSLCMLFINCIVITIVLNSFKNECSVIYCCFSKSGDAKLQRL